MEITDSLFVSLNFEGTEPPKRICLVPAGKTIAGRDGRAWKNPNPRALAERSLARLPKLPIDINHSTDLAAPKGGESPAAGWITSLNADATGAIYGDVEWTPRGEAAMTNKEYGFISPVFFSNSAGEINSILRAGLTNSPNLGLPALNSEQKNNNDMEVPMKKELCAALGLPETATDTELIAAVTTVAAQKQKVEMNAAQGAGNTVDLAVYAPRAEVNAALTRAVAAEQQLVELNAAALKKEAEGEVDAAIKAGKIPPKLKGWYVDTCSTKEGVEKFKAVVADMPALIDGKVQVPDTPPPAAAGNVSLNSEDAAMVKAMGYTTEEYKKIMEAGK
jgi:phage I-like protein